MVGTMQRYELVYSESFSNSLSHWIDYWEETLNFPEDKIKQFIEVITTSFQLMRQFPSMHEEVSIIYGFTQPTFRLLIGKQYAIFYRVNHEKKEVIIGQMVSQKQMKVQF